MVSGFQTAELTSGEYSKVRGDHSDKWFVILCQNTTVFKAQVNQSSFDDSFADVTFDNVTTGAYTDALEGMTVLISHSDDRSAAFFRGRVRKAATSDTLYINETSLDVADDDYIFVIKDYALWERTPHQDSSGTLYIDWDKAFEGLPPIIRDVPSVVYGRLSGGVFDVDFAPTALAAALGTSISAWSSALDGGSYQSGNASSQNFTARFTSAGRYFVRINVTDSAGVVGYFICKVLVNDSSNSIVAKGIEVTNIANLIGDGLNTRLTVRAGSDVTNVLDQTEIYIVSDEIFGDSDTDSIINNVLFIGRIRSDENRVRMSREAGLTSSVNFEVDGMGAQMARLILASIAMRRITSASVFGEVPGLTLWRGQILVFAQLSNLVTQAAITFDDETTTYGVPLLGTETRSVGDTAQTVAFAINAFLNFSPSGEIHIARHMQYQNSTDKAALIVAANFTLQDVGGNTDLIAIKREHILKYGRIVGFGGSYNTATGDVTALRAIAPARVFSSGAGRSQFNSQVLPVNLTLSEMKDAIALRTGADYAVKNQQVTLTAQMPGAYRYLRPSSFQRYTWTLAASVTKTGRAYTTADYWWLQSVTLTHYHEQSRTETEGKWVLDTQNVSAKVVAEIAPDDIPYSAPTILPFPASPFPMLDSLKFPDGAAPAPQDEQPYTAEEVLRTTSPGKQNTDPDRQPDTSERPEAKQGAIVMVGNASGVWITEKFTKSGNPPWKDITPATGMKRATFNPFSGGLYALSYDGADSYVWRADNAFNPAWLAATQAGREYTQIAVRNAPNVLYALSRATGTTMYDDDLTSGLGAQSHEISATYPYGIYNGTSPSRDGPVAGAWIATGGRTGGGCIEGALVNANNLSQAGIAIRLSQELTILAVSFWTTHSDLFGALSHHIGFWDDADTPLDEIVLNGGGVTSYGQVSWSGTQANVRTISINTLSNQTPANTAYLDDISITIDTGNGIATIYSTDGGATWAAQVTAGTDPGSATGFASEPGGSTIYVGADTKVVEASSGGAYSDSTGGGTTGTYPIAIAPYTGGNFYMASAAAVGGETMWRVVGGSATAITPNDGSNNGLCIGQLAICISPTDDTCLFAICNFGGTLKLARSTNGGSSWSITTGLSASATCVRPKNNDQVYIANGNSILYSEDGGATFVTKPAPGASLLFLEVA